MSNSPPPPSLGRFTADVLCRRAGRSPAPPVRGASGAAAHPEPLRSAPSRSARGDCTRCTAPSEPARRAANERTRSGAAGPSESRTGGEVSGGTGRGGGGRAEEARKRRAGVFFIGPNDEKMERAISLIEMRSSGEGETPCRFMEKDHSKRVTINKSWNHSPGGEY